MPYAGAPRIFSSRFYAARTGSLASVHGSLSAYSLPIHGQGTVYGQGSGSIPLAACASVAGGEG